MTAPAGSVAALGAAPVPWAPAGPPVVVLVAVAFVGVLVGARRRHQRNRLRHRLLAGPGTTRGARRPDPGSPMSASLAAGWRSVAVAVGSPLRRLTRRPADGRADAAVGGSAVVAALALALGSGLAVAAAAGFTAWALPVTRRVGRRSRLRRARADEAPEIVDLIRLGTGAGLNVRLAIEAVVRHHDGILAADLRAVLDRVERGERLADALDSAGDAGDALQPLIDALVASERYGAPLVAALDRVAADARTARRRRREEAARRVPVKLLFPLVFCTLPAFALLTVVPVLLRSLPSLAP